MRAQRPQKSAPEAQPPIVHPHAAGIDIGANEIYVAVDPQRDQQPVRRFATFTEELHALADWLQRCGIDTVAMESTGVYWIPLYQILEERGMKVFLVNARHVKNVPGRKTDVGDCQWLQYLHAVGLLRASFRPSQEVCAIRTLWRHREGLVQLATEHTQHMHKALDQMNLQIHHVISDITGVTGLAIVDAILAGERDARELAKHRHPRIQASEETVIKALVGDYRKEHLFTLRQALASYRHYQQLILECDREMEQLLKQWKDPSEPPPPPLTTDTQAGKKRQGNGPYFAMREHLYRIFGVDLLQIPGVSAMVAGTLLAEIGSDLSKFRSASAFASWLGLCPHNDISGGKILAAKTRRVKSRAAKALRLAAQALHRSQSALGAYYRRMRAKLGGPQAITATAHKLARIIYHLITTRQPYHESIFLQHDEAYRRRTTARLNAQAKALGLRLVPIESQGQ